MIEFRALPDKPGDETDAVRTACSWTARQRETFLDELETHGNVSAAARAAGLSARSTHRLRRDDADFAAQWDLALEIVDQELAAVLLRRAINGTEHGVYYGGKLVGSERAFSDRLAIEVLARTRRKGAGDVAASGQSADPAAVIAAIEQRLDQIRHNRAGAEEADGDQ